MSLLVANGERVRNGFARARDAEVEKLDEQASVLVFDRARCSRASGRDGRCLPRARAAESARDLRRRSRRPRAARAGRRASVRDSSDSPSRSSMTRYASPSSSPWSLTETMCRVFRESFAAICASSWKRPAAVSASTSSSGSMSLIANSSAKRVVVREPDLAHRSFSEEPDELVLACDDLPDVDFQGRSSEVRPTRLVLRPFSPTSGTRHVTRGVADRMHSRSMLLPRRRRRKTRAERKASMLLRMPRCRHISTSEAAHCLKLGRYARHARRAANRDRQI